MRQSDKVGTELLECSVTDAVFLGLFGVVASVVCCHQHLSLHRRVAHYGILSPTVSDDGRDWQARVSGFRLSVWGCAELGRRDAEGGAVVQFVPFGEAALAAFPAVDVVRHAVDAGQGGVAGGPAGLNELTSHLASGPSPGLALLAQPGA
jgi:hypothetical protein